MIADYFNRLADKLAASGAPGGVSTHRPDIGDNRESALRDVLNRHSPDRLTAMIGGFAIGLDGSHSKQLDIIVRADNSPRLEEQDRSFIAVESMFAAFSVKSGLDKATLIDSLENFASIPQLSKSAFSLRNLAAGAADAFLLRHPATFLFAFDGVSSDSCVKSLEEFLRENPDFPRNRFPQQIVVHGKYIIAYARDAYVTKRGVTCPADSFVTAPIVREDRGLQLARIIQYIHSYLNLMSYLNIDLQKYIDSAYNVPPEEG
jgi:hypothetical protein